MENELMPVNGQGEKSYDQLKAENMELTTDMRLVKNSIYQLLEKVGFVNPDGSFRETINMKQILDVAMKATTNSKKFKEDMSFLAECLPLVEKYKNL